MRRSLASIGDAIPSLLSSGAALSSLLRLLSTDATTAEKASTAAKGVARSIVDRTPITKRLWEERISSGGLKTLEGTIVAPPIPKVPMDSAVTIPYPFTQDAQLRELYRSPWGYVRIGKILEDLDSLAGNVSFNHCSDDREDTRPPMLVTASIDRIRLQRSMSIDRDLAATGRVIWTGKSSLDVLLQIIQDETPSLSAVFTFVAQDPLTLKPIAINPLLPETNEENQAFDERHNINEMRKAFRASEASRSGSGSSLPPLGKWADALLAEAKGRRDMPSLAQPDGILMSDTVCENTFVCQPQHKNLGGRIFGGFLLRRSFEIAFATAYRFAGRRPGFVGLDDVSFRVPVDVGSLLRLKAHVIHTAGDKVHVEVVASVVKPESVSSVVTNSFNYTFRVGEGPGLRRVLPSTPEEAAKLRQFFIGKA